MAGANELQPTMGLGSTTMLIIGSMIGSGIFLVPAAMYVSAGSAGVVILAFLLGGLLSLSGAMVFSELAAAYPRAGGQAVYLREAFGKLPAFLFTWTSFAAIQTASIAAIAIAFADTADKQWGLPGTEGIFLGPVELPKWGVSFLAVALVWILTAINYRGVRHATYVNNTATVAKLGGLAFVAMAAFAFTQNSGNFEGNWFGGISLSGAGLALAAGLFAFDGWAQPTFIASEVKDPTRNVPRAILIGVGTVTVVYVIIGLAYFWAIPGATITADTPIAQDTARLALGSVAAVLVTIAIMISTLGATNSYVLTSPRIYYDEAREGQFPSAFAKISRFKTPGYGLWFQGIVSSLFALSGTFNQLLTIVIATVYGFYLLATAAHFRLRRRHPEKFTKFRMPLFPLPFLIFAIVGSAMLLNLLIEDVVAAIVGVALVLAGVPVFYAMRRSTGSGAQAPK